MYELLEPLFRVFGSFTAVLLVGLVVVVYLLPTLIALKRRRRNLPGIAFFNIVLGWTGIAWAATLVDALSREE